MTVTAWRSGTPTKKSVTYGICIGAANRNHHFQREWHHITVETDDGSTVEVPVSEGFWHKCPEVRHPFFSVWFRKHRLLPWRRGHPPTFDLELIGGSRFKLTRMARVARN